MRKLPIASEMESEEDTPSVATGISEDEQELLLTEQDDAIVMEVIGGGSKGVDSGHRKIHDEEILGGEAAPETAHQISTGTIPPIS